MVLFSWNWRRQKKQASAPAIKVDVQCCNGNGGERGAVQCSAETDDWPNVGRMVERSEGFQSRGDGRRSDEEAWPRVERRVGVRDPRV
ncbi:hypothetical protein CCHR01_19532 [Colletotrichum chrysophilum]|uniref:Uncharacterized protein n=1 Tax=Colletotrichum chrysophilum TaxID=1836956 RepID=A0AAD9E7Q8_9PEZI|nr:hypothetical protein CCHR01_19532 [Colletotrichum chrysophilum]